MNWLLRFSVNHPARVLLLAAIVSAAACAYAPGVRLRLDARSLIPADDPALVPGDQASAYFGLNDMIVIGISSGGSDIYRRETLERVERVGRKLAAVRGVVPGSVASLATVPHALVEGGQMETRPVLTSSDLADQHAAERVRRDVERLGLNDGILVARDGHAAAVFAQVEDGADRYSLLNDARRIVASEGGGGDSLHLGGTALAQAAIGDSAATDMARLVPAVFLVLALILGMAFRHPLPALVSLTEVGVSLLWTIGLMGAVGQSVFITTLVMPVIIIAIGVSDDVYALRAFFDQSQKDSGAPVQRAVFEAFGRVKKSILLTSGTTAAGLLSLSATPLEPQKAFGIYGAIAIGCSALLTFTLVPSMLVLACSRGGLKGARLVRLDARRIAAGVNSIVAANPRHVLAIALAVLACSALLVTRLRVDDAWVNNLPASSDLRRGDRFLNDRLAGTTSVELMIDSGSDGGLVDPATLARLGEVERELMGLSQTGACYGIFTDVVRFNSALRGLSYSEFRAALEEGRASLTRDEIEQALLLTSSAARGMAGERADESHRRARLTILVRDGDYQRVREVCERAVAAGLRACQPGGQAVPFGEGWISFQTVRLLVKGQIYSLVAALVLDLMLLALLLRSLPAAVFAMVPVGFSLLVVFALLGLLNVPLGIANSMFASLVCGIGLDFSVHFTAVFRQGRTRGLPDVDSTALALVRTGPSIITSAAALTAGLSALTLSEVAPNVQLGMVLSICLLVCSTATLTILPGLILLKRTRHDYQQTVNPIVDRAPHRFAESLKLWDGAGRGGSVFQGHCRD